MAWSFSTKTHMQWTINLVIANGHFYLPPEVSVGMCIHLLTFMKIWRVQLVIEHYPLAVHIFQSLTSYTSQHCGSNTWSCSNQLTHSISIWYYRRKSSNNHCRTTKCGCWQDIMVDLCIGWVPGISLALAFLFSQPGDANQTGGGQSLCLKMRPGWESQIGWSAWSWYTLDLDKLLAMISLCCALQTEEMTIHSSPEN